MISMNDNTRIEGSSKPIEYWLVWAIIIRLNFVSPRSTDSIVSNALMTETHS